MPEKFSKYRNSKNQRMLSGLFLETRPVTQSCDPVYTLKDWDHVRPDGTPYPSLYLLYMSLEDLTEYEFVNQCLDGWEHWQMLCQANFFKPYIARWREELQLKIKARALQRLKAAAEVAEGKSYVELNKYLANEQWRPGASKGRGRPSSAEISSKLLEETNKLLDLEQDYERVFGPQTKIEGSA